MVNNLSFGIILKYFIAEGNNTMPDESIRSDATWYADKFFNPSFINIKLLPHIIESTIKMSQFKNPCFNEKKLRCKGEGFTTKYLKMIFLFLK